jgi:putative transposase
MKRKRHNPEQIIRKLRSAEQLLNQSQTVADVCRALDVSAATYDRWQHLYGGMKATEAKLPGVNYLGGRIASLSELPK